MFQITALAVIAVLTVIDQVTKYYICEFVKGAQPIEFLFGTFQFRYVENTGASFSLFSEKTEILTVVTSVMIVACLALLMIRKFKPIVINIALIAVVSGGIGNLIDRIRFGYVVDFIEPMFVDFAVFNVADSFLTVGAILLAIHIVFIYEEPKKKKKDEEKDENNSLNEVL